MSKSLILYLAVSVLALIQPQMARARSYSYVLSDGLLVTMDVQATQRVFTLVGQPNANYRFDCTVQLNGWTTLTNAALNAAGTFVYADRSQLPACFYRVLSSMAIVSVDAVYVGLTDSLWSSWV